MPVSLLRYLISCYYIFIASHSSKVMTKAELAWPRKQNHNLSSNLFSFSMERFNRRTKKFNPFSLQPVSIGRLYPFFLLSVYPTQEWKFLIKNWKVHRGKQTKRVVVGNADARRTKLNAAPALFRQKWNEIMIDRRNRVPRSQRALIELDATLSVKVASASSELQAPCRPEH